CVCRFGVCATDLVVIFSSATPGSSRFPYSPALSRLFTFAPGTACQRNRRAFATNAVHRQFIACLKRSIRRSEGAVSTAGRRCEKNLAIGIGATKRRAKLPVAHFRRKRATA